MADIKTKIKSTIKSIDKTHIGTQKIKDNLIEVKEKADTLNDKQYNSAEEYATQNIKDKTEIIANKSINDFDKLGRKSFVDSKNRIQNEIEKYKIRQEEKQQIKNNIIKSNEIRSLQDTEKLQANKNKFENIGNIKSKDSVIKANSKSRAFNKNMKQTNNLSKKAIKTSGKVEKNTEILMKENIKTSQKIKQATKKFAEQSVKTAKHLAKATAKAIKAIVTETKALIELLIAGGWISVIIILVLVLLGGAISFIKVGSAGSTDSNAMTNFEITSPMVSVAKTQLRQVGGEPYWSWYGFKEREAWCACFVSWCADQCGLIETGQIPRYSICSDGINYFKNQNRWQDRSTGYKPQQGDIIFFDWQVKNDNGDLVQDGISDHTGIVEYYDSNSNIVYTIEGNSHDECKERTYNADDVQIMGYGTMNPDLNGTIQNVNGTYYVDQDRIEEELTKIKNQDLMPLDN